MQDDVNQNIVVEDINYNINNHVQDRDNDYLDGIDERQRLIRRYYS